MSSSSLYRNNEEFWEGSDGLVFDFVDENPPEMVFEDTPFSVALDVANQGAHTLTGFITLSIEEDYMCLVDDNNECSTFDAVDVYTTSVKDRIESYYAEIDSYSATIAALDDDDEIENLKDKIQEVRKNIEALKDSVPIAHPYKTKWFSLEGKSIFNYNGGTDVLEYKAKAKSAGRLSEEHEVTVVATACYDYTTKWNQEICIDTDINKMNIFEGACEATDISLTSQGAPLTITKIESHMIPTGTGYIRPMFTIYVQNKGNGKVINKEKIEHACTSTGLSSKDYNMVFLKEFMLSNDQLVYDFNGYDPTTGKEINPDGDGDTITCKPNPLILENNGKDYITCIVNEDIEWDMFSLEQAPYSTTLAMQFDYGYTLSQSEQITIKRLLS